jgi:protein-tyrosine phosphatase
VLFGLDDGARDAAASQSMIQGLCALGFDTVCATPHQRVGYFLPSESERQDGFAEALKTVTGQLELRLGAENMWDEVFHSRAQDGTVPTLGGTKAFLFELPLTTVPANLEDQLFQFRRQGLLPVMAHPERYRRLDEDRLRALAAHCALLVDLGAVAGYHGSAEAKTARFLLKENIAHAVASDVHTPDDVRLAAEGMAWIEKKIGAAALDRLLDTTPRAILSGTL